MSEADATQPSQTSSLAGMDEAQAPEAALAKADPGASEALSSGKLPRSTTDFPANPSTLTRQELEVHYRDMRDSHKFLVRSRAQLFRRSRESRSKRQDLLDTLRRYEEQFAAIGRERVEQFEIARELQQKLESFERDQRDLDQLLSQVEEVHGQDGFWSVLKVAELLKRMRELFLRNGIRQ